MLGPVNEEDDEYRRSLGEEQKEPGESSKPTALDDAVKKEQKRKAVQDFIQNAKKSKFSEWRK